jgi:hypothetical protein
MGMFADFLIPDLVVPAILIRVNLWGLNDKWKN